MDIRGSRRKKEEDIPSLWNLGEHEPLKWLHGGFFSFFNRSKKAKAKSKSKKYDKREALTLLSELQELQIGVADVQEIQ